MRGTPSRRPMVQLFSGLLGVLVVVTAAAASPLLRRERPDLLGTQEGLYQQLRDIAADLPDRYDSIRLGREGGSHGEAMQIFYDSARLEPLEFDHYWLSDTPDVVGSKTRDGCCPRMVTWARFLDHATGVEFYALNTHLEAFDPSDRPPVQAVLQLPAR